MPSILRHFDALTQHGLQVIPLWQNSKVPMFRGWTNSWNRDDCRIRLERHQDANIGVLLGPIVDVEGDSEEANQIITNLIGDYPHPAYRSTKSIHHLFVTPDASLRHLRVGKIEFRGFGHQSVLPPSQHEGVCYKWLRNFKFPIPEMPEELVAFYYRHKNRRTFELKPGHVRAWCDLCGKKSFLHQRRFSRELQAFSFLGQKWQCKSCRQVDLRRACRLLRKRLSVELVKEALANS